VGIGPPPPPPSKLGLKITSQVNALKVVGISNLFTLYSVNRIRTSSKNNKAHK
jgi:hypothetical protein